MWISGGRSAFQAEGTEKLKDPEACYWSRASMGKRVADAEVRGGVRCQSLR